MTPGIDYKGIAVVFLCHDGKGNFVLMKRSENARNERGTWDFGGGAVEITDTIEETLLKEIKEEYGVEPLIYEFLGYRDIHTDFNDKKNYWISFDFKVLVDREKVRIGEPHKFTELAWFRLDSLPTPLYKTAPIFLEKYKEKLK